MENETIKTSAVAPTYTLADKMLAGHEATFTVNWFNHTIPLWKLVEHLVHITDKNDNDVRFRYNYQQCLSYLEKCKLKESGRDVRTNTLKARQIGITTMEAAEQTIIALYTPNTRCAILADTLEHAQNIFEKVQYIYDHLDMANPARKKIEENPKANAHLSYKPSLKYNKGQKMLQTRTGNSKIEVICVSDSAGRSSHYTRIHCSEVAFWNGMEKALLSLSKTVSRGNPNSSISLETTANGYNDYKLRWDRDYAGGEGSFLAIFHPWFKNPEYRKKIPLGYDLMSNMTSWEIEKMKKHNLDLEQMYWFHLEFLESGGNKDTTLQEDPFDPIDAFISTGSSVFNKDLIEIRKRELAEAHTMLPADCRGLFACKHLANEDQSIIEVPKDSIKWYPTRDGPIDIFEKPLPGHPYVITCDPFMGGSDDVAMQVIDNYNCKQVARFKSNKYTNDKCAWQLYCLGIYYNTALISSESNVGQIVMELLVKAHYPKLYVTQAKVFENYTQTIKRQFGHKTTVANRQYMIDAFAQAFEENAEIINDYDTICEMESFQLVEHRDKDGKVVRAKQEAAGGAHDDLVMAFAGFFFVRNQQTALIIEPKDDPNRVGQSFAEIEAAYFKNQERKNNPQIRIGDFGIKW